MFHNYLKNFLLERKSFPFALAFLIAATLLSGSFFVSHRLRVFSIQQAESRASDTAKLVRLVFENICNNAEVALDVANLRLGNVNDGHAAYLILKAIPLAKHVIQLSVVDPNGHVIASNLTDKSGLDLSDREHIRVQLDKSHIGTYISAPVVGRISKHKTIQITKRYLDERGRILRILVLSYSFDDLAAQLERVDLGPNSVIAIVGDDGLVRMRLYRDRNSALHISSGQELGGAGLFRRQDSSTIKTIMRKSPIDGNFRIGAALYSDFHNTYIYAGISDDFALSANHKLTSDLSKVIVLVVMFSAVLVAVVITVQTADSRRRAVMSVRRMESDVLRLISRMSGVSIATVSANQILEFIEDPRHLVTSRCAIQRYIRMNIEQIDQLFRSGETNRVHLFFSDDEWHEVSISCVSAINLYEDGRSHKIIFALDQTEQRKNANKLYQVSKLAAIGELAAGMAHEIHQPLATIRFCVNNARISVERGDIVSVDQKFQTIDNQIDKIKSLIGHLRHFGRPSDYSSRKDHLDIFAIVDSACSLIRYQYEEAGIEIIVHKLANVDSGFLVGDPNGIEQVVLNVMQNAKYAIQKRRHKECGIGRIEICVGFTEICATISIRDNGGGIKVKSINKIFEPFFSTKPFNEGGGLGLSICKDILQEHGGSIEAENVEEGACFHIMLPLVKEDDAVTIV